METVLVLKIITLIMAIIGLPKIIFEMTLGRKARLREDYNFAKDFLSAKNEEIHPFALEKGYQAIAGNTLLKPREAAYILSLEDPVKSLNRYTLGYKYFAELPDNKNTKLNFKDKYLPTWKRYSRKLFYFAFYIIFVFFALSPLFLKNNAVLLLATIPFFGFYAAISLRALVKIVESERLIKNQKKRD